ncbi:MAG: helix-turn-helix transcriptional regulator [Vicingaceae bacterium]|nr:helix-turn-helix transcriptional regulator [Vicingaceae bacterium]
MLDEAKYQESLVQLGTNLRRIRKEKGFTMREVAERCGMEENNYGRFEKALTNPTYKSLLQICSVLEVELKDLLDF